MYTKFIDTVSIIVKTYGIGILSDNKFWNIMTDSYNFSSGYSLRDEFKKCIANGNFSAIDSLQSDRKNALKFIKDVVQNNTNYCNTKELTLCLFSVAIAIGTCSKTDYCNFTGSYSQNPSTTPKNKPKTAPKPQNKPLPNYKSLNQFSIWTIIIWGIISLIGSTSLYAWFLLGNAGMFWILCLIGIIQLGTLKVLDEFLQNAISNEAKSRIIILFFPILIGYIINAIIPLILCFDSIADSLYHYFSVNFVPESYFYEPVQCAWYAPRVSNEVGFFGAFASIALFISLVSCRYRLYIKTP